MNLIQSSRALGRRGYERAIAPFGRRAVEQMLRGGLPSRLGPALRFLFSGEAPEAAQRAANQIEDLRAAIAARSDVFRYAYSDSPLGPVRLAQRIEESNSAVTAHLFATNRSVPKRWGMFLHLCADSFEARVILEMGSCVGISGAYLASAHSRPRLLTLEGSEALAAIAQQTLNAVSDNAEVVVGVFEQTLQRTLDRLSAEQQKIDLAFVDGHHEEAATLNYVDAISKCLSPRGLIILDDIYLYEGMWLAWQVLSSDRRFVAIDIGRFGLLVRGEGSGNAYNLARYTGRWRVGGQRQMV